MKSNASLRKLWLEEAKNIPEDATLYVETMAARVDILIADIEELETKYEKLKALYEVALAMDKYL